MGCEMSSHIRHSNKSPRAPDSDQQLIKQTNIAVARSHPTIQEALRLSCEKDDYTPLLVLISDSTREEVTEPFPRWAEAPQTMGCAALAVLNRQFRRGPVLFADGSLAQARDQLLAGLEHSRNALSQHVLYFCYRLGKQGNIDFMQDLANNGLFHALFKLLARPRPIFFLYTMKLVALLLEQSPPAKAQFLEAGGVEKCLHILRGTRGRGLGFVETLRAFLALVGGPDGEVDLQYAAPVVAGFTDVDLDQLQLHSLNPEQRQIFNTFMRKLLEVQATNSEN